MKVGFSLGSNLGDRLRQLQQARAYLLSLSREQWHRASPLYETEPVGCPPNSPKFYNAALEIEFGGAPRTLLKKIQAYEIAHGRDRNLPPNAARPIDIDILYFGEKEIVGKDLIIPHPRIAERRFVLVPLATICPERIIKGTGKTVQMLLRELPVQAGEVKFVRHDW